MKEKDVFISYSSKECKKAYSIRAILENNDISCWMAPEDIPAGGNYAAEITKAIRGCKVFLLILSKDSQESVYVEKELDKAIGMQKIVIPFDIDGSKLCDSFDYYLTNVQRINAYIEFTEACEILVHMIKNNLGLEEIKKDIRVKKYTAKDEEEVRTGKTSIDKDGVCYTGDRLFGKRHGYGSAVYPDGGTYEGYWKLGKKCGYGTMKYANGDVYEGIWKNDSESEKGVLTFANGDECEVTFCQSKYHKVVLRYANGNIYEGEYDWYWRGNERIIHGRNGYGEMKYADGGSECGNWVRDTLNDG